MISKHWNPEKKINQRIVPWKWLQICESNSLPRKNTEPCKNSESLIQKLQAGSKPQKVSENYEEHFFVIVATKGFLSTTMGQNHTMQ